MTLLTDVLRRRQAPARATSTFELASASPPPAPLGRSTEVFLVVAALMAVAFRCRMLLVGRSLWLDESMLALNICGRSFGELLRPLDYDQGAPIGFLFLEKLATLAFGPTELALRIVPFVASLASLGLIYRLCAANLGRHAAAAGVALAGFSPAMVYYAAEVKQYGVDVAVGLLILAVAADALRLGVSVGRGVALAVVGAVAVWLSHPSVFVLAGAGTAIIVNEALAGRYRPAASMAGISAFWLANFAIGYLLFLKDLGSNSYLAEFWDGAFLPFPPTSPKHLRNYAAVGFGLFESPFINNQADVDLSPRMGVMMAAAWLVGVAALARPGRWRMLALLTAPLAFALVAAMLQKYPLKGRLAIFTIALTYPMIAAGIAGLMESRERLGRVSGLIFLACALLLPAMQATQALVERPRLHDARNLLSEVAREWKPGDIVVVDRYSSPPFRYYQAYGPDAALDQIEPTETELSLNEPEELTREVARWKGHHRVWFLFDTALPDPINPSRKGLFVVLDREGERLASYSCRRYSAHLYRLD